MKLETIKNPDAGSDPNAPKHLGRAGIAPTVHVPRQPGGSRDRSAPPGVVDRPRASVGALGDLFSPSGISSYFHVLTTDNKDTNSPGEPERFVSPVGFGRLATQAAESGWVQVAFLLIAINMFVGLFNLVPLLPFDGGHIAIATYEKIASTIRRRPVQVDVAKLMPITAVVLGVLAFIFLSSLFLDITHPVGNPF